MSFDFTGVHIKTERAKEHIRNLETVTAQFVAREPYVGVPDQDAQTGHRLFRIQVREQPDPSWGAIAGDAVHNLRSALDLLMWQLVLANGRPPTDSTCFPIAWDSKAYQSSKRTKIDGTDSRVETLLDAVKPYRGGNSALWQLHRLDIVDKHHVSSL